MKTIEELKNKIICGDTLEVLKEIPDESIDMVITSPPYYALRNYQVGGQIGLESTFEEYLKKILDITAEIKRVLKKSGSFWLNLGDIYGSHTFGNSKSAGGIQKKLCQEAEGFPRYSNKAKSLGDKCLGMMPERIALAMIDQQGWILRNKIKWAKQVFVKKENRTIGSVMPTSVKDRFNESGEELYFFVKNKKYYSNLDAVRLPNQVMGVTDMRAEGFVRSAELYYNSKYNQAEGQGKIDGASRFGKNTKKYKTGYEGGRKMRKCPSHNLLNNPLGKNLPTIWLIGSEPHNFKKELDVDVDHFAIFPQALLEIPIKFGCPKDGIVLDPFMGSGTTAIVAKKLGRNFVGIELNPQYIKIAEARIKSISKSLSL